MLTNEPNMHADGFPCIRPVGHEGRCRTVHGYHPSVESRELRAALDRSAAEAKHYAELAHARWVVAERLRGELAVALGEVAKLRTHVAECHGFQNNVAAVVGVDTDWDAAGRAAVVDAVCRMSGNLADLQRGAS